MGQRGIRADQVEYVFRFGKVYHRAGATWFVLRRKDVPPDELALDRVQKCVGIVVCVVSGEIATVYHRSRPSHYIRRKPKRDLKQHRLAGAAAV